MTFHKEKEYRKQAGIRLGLLIPVLAVLSAAALFLLLQQYTNSFRVTFGQETQAYLQEITQQVTLVMNDRVDANMKNIETDALALARMELKDQSDIVEFLDEEATRYGCSMLSLAGHDGIALTNKSQTLNVAQRKHYLTALQGENAVSGLITSNYSNTDSIEYAVPIINQGVVKGVLLATYDLADFREILQVNMFDGQGVATVIDRQGVIIINNSESAPYNYLYMLKDNPTVAPDNYAQFTKNLALGASGMLHYSVDGMPLMMYYQPLDINDWTLLISVPTAQITYKTDLFLRGTAYVGIVIAVLVTALMLLVVISQYSHRRMLEQLVYVDPVTQGNSYAKFKLEAQKKIDRMGPGYYALLQLNLEKFKLINTTFGREEGNRLLRYIHTTLCEYLLPDELLARVNADRFCLLIQLEPPEQMAAKLAEVCERVNRFNGKKATTYRLHLNGGACIVDTEAPDLDMLYERANFARLHGVSIDDQQDRIAFFNELEQDIVLREKEIENNMEAALAQGEFEVYLQPKYWLKNKALAGAEALVRWRDPQRGLISPGEFIPLFERNGFIVDLDLYMFDQVCKFQQKLWEGGQSCVPISVNLSRRHLDNLNFIYPYKDIFARYTFPANLLEIELTESIVFNNMQLLCNVINQIHEIGFECSMDDFGSGYSSLNLLKDIPVDTLKLDRAFFSGNLAEDVKSRYVIQAVLDLAGKLNMKTVSEGVETAEQVDYLHEMHCDMVQGYVFAKPMPASQFWELITSDT